MSLYRQLALELRTAARQRIPVVPISTRHPDLTVDEAYAIQGELRTLDLVDGAVLVGHKIGATSEAIRRMFGVDHPDFGYLTDRMMLPNDAEVRAADLIAPMIEGEIAFRMRDAVFGISVTAANVLANTSEIIPVLEVLDSRIDNWAIQLVDTVADNASSAAAVLGSPVALDGVDLAAERMRFEADGQVLLAQGRDVLGHPAEAVAWLARMLSHYDKGIDAGDIVLAGAWCGAQPLTPGSTAVASFESLGAVSLTVV